MITPKEASIQLGVHHTTLLSSNKYNKFYIKPSEGRRDARFDLDAYLHWQEVENSLTAQVGLLVEYIHHVENVSYEAIAQLSKVHVVHLHAHNFGFKMALKIARAIREFRFFWMKRYLEYYSYNSDITIKRQRLF